ncbi:hypothetical protein ACGFI5_00270 [Micromonospora tulbaghiae]|uniref:hypothetical protein n=1 Tax=Micromonospora TaxID=1873 RepID=UPI00364CBFC7
MSAWEIAVSVVFGLAVNELCELSPWLARRLLPFAARMWTRDAESRAAYAEEWQAIIEDRPGKLFKLATAFTFLVGGAWRSAPRLASRWSAQHPVRRLISSVLITTSTFVIMFGFGMSSWPIVALGTALLVLATALGVLPTPRRQYKFIVPPEMNIHTRADSGVDAYLMKDGKITGVMQVKRYHF